MIIAYSGSHSTGKTTSAEAKFADLKAEFPDRKISILPEVARDCPYPINQQTTRASQEWIFVTQLSRELELMYDSDIIVTDRTAVDSIAYTYVAGFNDLADRMMEYVRCHMKRYSIIYFRKIKPGIKILSDGIRDEDLVYRKNVEDELLKLYYELGLSPSDSGFHIE